MTLGILACGNTVFFVGPILRNAYPISCTTVVISHINCDAPPSTILHWDDSEEDTFFWQQKRLCFGKSVGFRRLVATSPSVIIIHHLFFRLGSEPFDSERICSGALATDRAHPKTGEDGKVGLSLSEICWGISNSKCQRPRKTSCCAFAAWVAMGSTVPSWSAVLGLSRPSGLMFTWDLGQFMAPSATQARCGVSRSCKPMNSRGQGLQGPNPDPFRET